MEPHGSSGGHGEEARAPDLAAGSAGARERVALAGTFTGAAARYWVTIFPHVCREVAHWRRRAGAIPDPVLRGLAVDAFGKRGNIEGAAACAVFAPRARRAAVVRALVAVQSAYNYADLLSEQPSGDPVANARRLHEALLVALDPAASHLDYYEHQSLGDDGGYLAELLDASRAAVRTLPSYPVVATAARTAAERIVAFQSLSLGERSDALEAWARELTPACSELAWWETAAAGGSSVGVHVLIAHAGEPALDASDVAAIEHAYFPWIGGLHSLLDSVVDEREDAETGQLSLIRSYETRARAAQRIGWIARRAVVAARGLPGARRHAVVMAGMVGYYASAAREPVLAGAVEAVGPLARPTLLVFGLRRRVARAREGRLVKHLPACRGWRDGEGADARAA